MAQTHIAGNLETQQKLTMRAHVIALLLGGSVAAEPFVVDWRVPQANDANPIVWTDTVVVPLGETVVIAWTDYFSYHEVLQLKNKAAYEACDLTGAVELAPAGPTGEAVIKATAATTYYACGVGDGFHCDNGQKLSVTGVAMEDDHGGNHSEPMPPMEDDTSGGDDMPGHGDHGGNHTDPMPPMGDDHSGHGGGDHGHGGDGGECAFNAPASLPAGPCQQANTYPLFCTAESADAAGMSGHHMMGGLYMPNGASPMCHGNYRGDANECECDGPEFLTPDDVTGAARAVSCTAAAAFAALAVLLV